MHLEVFWNHFVFYIFCEALLIQTDNKVDRNIIFLPEVNREEWILQSASGNRQLEKVNSKESHFKIFIDKIVLIFLKWICERSKYMDNFN